MPDNIVSMTDYQAMMDAIRDGLVNNMKTRSDCPVERSKAFKIIWLFC